METKTMKISALHETLALRFEEDMRFRKRAGLFLALFFAATAVLVLLHPPKRGLVGSYYLNARWAGAPNLTTRERKISLDRLRHEYPAMTANFSILWTGGIFIPASGPYAFATVSSDGSEIRIDGRVVADNGGAHGVEARTGTVDLVRGFHAIDVRYFQRTGAGTFEATWTPPGEARRELSTALLFARTAKTAAALTAYRVRQAVLPVLLVLWCLGLGLYILTPRTSSSSSGRRGVRRTQSPVSLRLFAFLLLIGLALNLLLSLYNERTVLDFARFFLRHPVHAGEDSWRQISNALDYLAAPHDRPLYSEIFFAQKHKFQYPPTSLLLLEPLRRLPYPKLVSAANFLSWLAVIAGAVFSALILARGLARLRDEARPSFAEKGLLFVLAFGFTITFYPLVKSFELGQIQTWLYFFFVLAVWAWTSGKKGFAGIFIGLICVIKPQLGLLAVWGWLRKEGRFATGIIATAGGLGLISLGLFGWANHVDYLRALAYMGKHGESYYTNQSVNGLLNRLLFNGTNLHGNPHAFAPYNRWVYLGTLISSAVLIGAALFWKRGGARRSRTADFLIAALTFTMASPIAWEHHYSVLLPIFAAALPLTLAADRGRRGVFWLGAAFVLSSTLFQVTNALANTRFNFLQSTLFAGALMLLFQLYRLREGSDETALLALEKPGLRPDDGAEGLSAPSNP